MPLSTLAGTDQCLRRSASGPVVITGDSTWVAGVGDENGTTVGRYATATAPLNGVVQIRNETDRAGSAGVPVICAVMTGGYRAVCVVDCPGRSVHPDQCRHRFRRCQQCSALCQVSVNSTIAAGEGGVFVLSSGALDSVIARIDTATNDVSKMHAPDGAAAPIAGAGFADGNMTFGGGYLWLRDAKALVVQVDPATNTVLAQYGPPAGWGGLAANDDAQWLSSAPTNTIWRVTLR